MSRKYSDKELELVRERGRERSNIERNLLMQLFEGFSQLTVSKDNWDSICLLDEGCSLEKYNNLTRADVDDDYLSGSEEVKRFYRVITALDKLEMRGLIERSIYFSSDHSPEDGFLNLNGKLDGTDAQTAIWLARCLQSPGSKYFQYPEYMKPNEYPARYTLEQIEYQLTTKGFDVALKFQEHIDNERRFNQQSELSARAVEASSSSARTARFALWAAGFIAIGSTGNLIFNLLKHSGIL